MCFSPSVRKQLKFHACNVGWNVDYNSFTLSYHINYVGRCHVTTLEGRLSRIHMADAAARDWHVKHTPTTTEIAHDHFIPVLYHVRDLYLLQFHVIPYHILFRCAERRKRPRLKQSDEELHHHATWCIKGTLKTDENSALSFARALTDETQSTRRVLGRKHTYDKGSNVVWDRRSRTRPVWDQKIRSWSCTLRSWSWSCRSGVVL